MLVEHRCRMALKWSFVRAFSLKDNTEQEIIEKDLFEQWLGQLAGVACDCLQEFLRLVLGVR